VVEVFKVVRRSWMTDAYFSVYAPLGWELVYRLGETTTARPPTGILIFLEYEWAARFYCRGTPGTVILRGEAGPFVQVPPSRVTGKAAPPEIIKALWGKGQIDASCAVDRWPIGTAACSWFIPKVVETSYSKGVVL
jgi:hypothetical protein